MLEKILTKMAKVVYPERNISVEKIGGRFFLHPRDTTGCNTYLLEGKYSYDEVVKLNALTTYCGAGFGFCLELGPIAFIGIPNPAYVQKSGYFKYKVHAYGTPFDEQSEYYFKAYTEKEAKNIGNYIVYGLEGLKNVAAVAPISQMSYVYDSRFKAKRAEKPKIFDMDCELKGIYSYKEAKILSTGTLKEKDGYSGEEQPIVFAIVGNGMPVGIINMWPSEIELVRGFRDVWEYGAEEPKVQTIKFLNKEEASKIQDFILYVYNYSSSGIGRDKYEIERYDRTLDKRFKFQFADGSDYRLIEHTELFK